MKILYLITKSESGGAQTHVAQLCRFFKDNNEVAVFSYPGGWLQTEVEKMGVKFLTNEYFSNSLNPFKIIKAYLKTKQIIKFFKPDLVHCHSSAAGVYGRLAVRNSITTLYTAHGWGFNIGISWWKKYLAIFVERFLSRYCQKIICVSQFVKDLALKYHIAPESKLEVVLNGIELLPEKLSDVEDFNIIYVGRLADPKEPLVLLQAAKQIKEKINIHIVGSGQKLKELENFVEKNKIQNVKLVGDLDREKTLNLLRKSKIFVLISKWEGLPLTILEAMSVGLPVVVSNVGGISEVVDTENGILVENTTASVKLALENLINNPELCNKMGETGRKKIKNIFSLDKMLEKINNIYNS